MAQNREPAHIEDPRKDEQSTKPIDAKGCASLLLELGGGVVLYLAGPLVLLAGFWNPVLWLLFIPLVAIGRARR